MKFDYDIAEGLDVYIESLETAGNKLTYTEWLAWIKEQEEDYAKQDERFKPLTDLEKKWVLEALKHDGFIEDEFTSGKNTLKVKEVRSWKN